MKRIIIAALALALVLAAHPPAGASGSETESLGYHTVKLSHSVNTAGHALILAFDFSHPVFEGPSRAAALLNEHIEDRIDFFMGLDSGRDPYYDNFITERVGDDRVIYVAYEAIVTYDQNGYVSILEYWRIPLLYNGAGDTEVWGMTINLKTSEFEMTDAFFHGEAARIRELERRYFLEYCGNNVIAMNMLLASDMWALSEEGLTYYLEAYDGAARKLITIPYTDEGTPIIDVEKALARVKGDPADGSLLRLPLTIYTIDSEKTTPTYEAIGGEAVGKIAPRDECVITSLVGDGYCYVTYPLDKGGTRLLYARTDAFLTSLPYATASVTKRATAYRRSSGSATIGYVDERDETVWICGEANGRTQIVYQITGRLAYKSGWVDNAALSPH